MKKKHKIAVIIVAAGNGQRFNQDIPKQYIELNGKQILRRSVETFLSHENVDVVQIVINPSHGKLYNKAIAGLSLPEVVNGGETRQESVLNGLKSLQKYKPDYVLIHDAARPLINKETINRVIAALKNYEAVIPVLPVPDTVKMIKDNIVSNTLNRNQIVLVQTPQGFHYKTILRAHEECVDKNFSDDAAIAENAGTKVSTVIGNRNNFKITTTDDLRKAEKIMYKWQENRVGMGFDVHGFDKKTKSKDSFLKLCGVNIPYKYKLMGHSDADVALHALVDAILGAIGEGDIGLHFHPSDNKWKGADSGVFVKYALDLLKKKYAIVNNVDITVICEEPKISIFREKMRNSVAKIMEIDKSRVNIKATTTEKLGFLGRKEGIAAQAILSISY